MLECSYSKEIWRKFTDDLDIHDLPLDINELWLSWRPLWVRQEIRIEWDITVMAVCWKIWNERNNRIFSQKVRNSSILIEVIKNFVTFWLVNFPKKQWKTFVRGRCKGAAGRRAMEQQATSLAATYSGEVVDAEMNQSEAEAIAVQPIQAQTSEGIEIIVLELRWQELK